MSASPKPADFEDPFAEVFDGPDLEPAPTPTPRRATGIREWESWRYRDVLIDALSRGELTCRDFAIGVIVSSFANSKGGGRCFPSIKAIAEKARLKVDDRGQCRVVSESIAKLKNLGAIEIEDRRWNQPNGYLLIGGHVESGTPLHVESGTPDNIVIQHNQMTKSGNFEGREANRPPDMLDADMRKIATEERVPEYDHRAQFDKWLAGDKPRNPKAAWRAWCKKYQPDSRSFEGDPIFTPKLRDIAVKAGIPRTEAESVFNAAMKPKLKKKSRVGCVVRWFEGVCKNEAAERRLQEPPAPEPREVGSKPSEALSSSPSTDGMVRTWDGIWRRRDGRPIGPVGTKIPLPGRDGGFINENGCECSLD
jgi:hypothetical protein